jgi:23S rRNA pseudouridine1911/1915/1917 synthase
LATYVIAESGAGHRLDHYLAREMPEHSRARIQEWIDAGRVRVNGVERKASYKVREGEEIEVEPAEPRPLNAFPEDIPLEILYEDEDVIAVNKPAGMVVHAGAGRHEGTLVNALLHRYNRLSQAGGALRPGIVHRIDKGTSGLLLIARTDAAHRALAAQFAGRTVEKTYLALVQGVVMMDKGTIDQPITRDPVRRTRMTARLGAGRTAHTDYAVLHRYDRFTFLAVRIGTGRTHQIRVHLASLGHPVAGDTLYGAAPSAEHRPFLHAWRIAFTSPARGDRVALEAPLPADLRAWLVRLGPDWSWNA